MRRSIVLAALILAGCDTTWYRPNTTEQQFYQDEYECQQASYGYGGIAGAGTATGGVVVGGLSRTGNRRIYQSCMRAKGYSTERG